MTMLRAFLAILAVVGLGGCLSTNQLGGGSSLASGSAGLAGNAQGAGSDLPSCSAPLGTVALVE
ncbi:MAG: hypothetical protein KDF64_15770, partial [Geminicoccaceae bacterium]|nr:hypothetical protein [Geminicoccaceae bacterium]